MEKALEILKHIEGLYVEQPNFNKFEKMAQNNPERVDAWAEAFKNYDLLDVLKAVDEYWRYKDSSRRPNVQKIEAMLNTQPEAVKTNNIQSNTPAEKHIDYAGMFMARDIKLGINRHLLPIYQRAVSYITQDMLLQRISSQEWHQLDWSGRCSRAMQEGLFNELENVLIMICTKLHGKKYQYNEPEM